VVIASLANFIVLADATIINIALPTMRAALRIPAAGLPWVAGSYSLAFGGCLVLGGLAADRLGPRRLFVVGTVLFALGSLGAALAGTGPQLFAGRVVQGIGGALFCPAALAVVTSTVTAPGPRARALAVWSGAGAAAVALGPVIGGALTAALGWPSVFWLPALLCLASAAAGARWLPGSAGARHHVAPEAGNAPEASDAPEAGDAPAGASEQLFPTARVAAACAALALASAALVGVGYACTLWVQEVLRLDPLWAGIALLPLSVGIVVGAVLAPALTRRTRERWLAVAGLAVAATGTLLLVLTPPRVSLPALMAVLLVVAVGFGLQSVPVSARATAVPRRHGLASAVYQTAGQLGGGVGLLVLTSVAASQSVAQGLAGDDALVAGYAAIFRLGALALALAAIVIFAVGRDDRPLATDDGDAVDGDLADRGRGLLMQQHVDPGDHLLAGRQPERHP
jgi:MFS family permease